MPYIVNQLGRTTPPSWPVRLNTRLPPPIFAALPTVGQVNIVTGVAQTQASGSTGALVRYGASGVAWYGDGSTPARSLFTGLSSGTEYTAVAIVIDSSGRNANRNPLDADNVDANRTFQLRFDSSNQANFIPFNTAVSAFSTTLTGVTSSPSALSVLGGRVKNGVASVWLNGKSASSTITGTPQAIVAAQNVAIGAIARPVSVSQNFAGDIYATLIYNVSLPDDVLIEGGLRPWGVYFAPYQRRIYFYAGAGGGTTYTASYDESFSLSDTLSSIATFGCVLNETMALTDQEQAPTTYPATFASIFSLIDDYTSAIGSTTLTGIYDESISLGDSIIATMTTLATCVESMPITDSFGAVATYIATLQDSVSLQDDVVQDGAILADVIYSISLGESTSSLAQFVSSYVESFTLDSTFAAAATLGTTVEETMSLQATFTATIPSVGGTVSETTFIWC